MKYSDRQRVQKIYDYAVRLQEYILTENDIYGAGCPLCHVERAIEELQRPYDGGTHILYVNGANRDDTPLGRLMQDFSVSVRSR